MAIACPISHPQRPIPKPPIADRSKPGKNSVGPVAATANAHDPFVEAQMWTQMVVRSVIP